MIALLYTFEMLYNFPLWLGGISPLIVMLSVIGCLSALVLSLHISSRILRTIIMIVLIIIFMIASAILALNLLLYRGLFPGMG
jgi:hypothetical protein